MTDLEDYTNRVIREAENIAYSTRIMEQAGITGIIDRSDLIPYEIIRLLLQIVPDQTKDPRRKLDLEELRDYWINHKEAILKRYPDGQK
jgi:hypothetical protein